MTHQQFITRQTVKYYWKALRQSTRTDDTHVQDERDTASEGFWEYEQTPRSLQ